MTWWNTTTGIQPNSAGSAPAPLQTGVIQTIPVTTTGDIPSVGGYAEQTIHWPSTPDPLRAAVAHAKELTTIMECFRDELKAMIREVLDERDATCQK